MPDAGRLVDWCDIRHGGGTKWKNESTAKEINAAGLMAQATWKGLGAPNGPRMKLESCCVKLGIATGRDVYHLSEIGSPPYVSGF